MERFREQPTRKVLPIERARAKKAQHRSTRVGETSRRNCEDFGGVRNHVIDSSPSRWTPIIVPKRTGRSGIGRGIDWLPGNGNCGKDQKRYESGGCAARSAFGDGEPRSCEGDRGCGWVGVPSGSIVARSPLCCSHVA